MTFAFVASMLFTPAAAQSVTDCGSGEAPGAFNDPCDNINSTDMCSISGTTLTCDMSAVCDAPPAWNKIQKMHAVTKSSGYSIFGTCWEDPTYHFQKDFCCRVDDSSGNITAIVLEGTDFTEEPLAAHFEGTGFDEDLEPISGKLSVTLRGNADKDVLEGSSSTSNNYTEGLYGNTGDDVLRGFAGADALYGGNGSDDLFGGDGDDKLKGGVGNDFLFGGEDDDLLNGGAGSDELNGEGGDDALWGGNGSDHLFGGDDDDHLCEDNIADVPHCPEFEMEGGEGGTDDDTAWVRANLACSLGPPTFPEPQGDEDVETCLWQTADSSWSNISEPGGPGTESTRPDECTDARNL